jgi:hypothetical protein
MEFLTNHELSSFVIRLWKDDEHGTWRGHITHIQSHQGCYFLTMSQMEDFISRFFSSVREETSQPSQPTIPST